MKSSSICRNSSPKEPVPRSVFFLPTHPPNSISFNEPRISSLLPFHPKKSRAVLDFLGRRPGARHGQMVGSVTETRFEGIRAEVLSKLSSDVGEVMNTYEKDKVGKPPTPIKSSTSFEPPLSPLSSWQLIQPPTHPPTSKGIHQTLRGDQRRSDGHCGCGSRGRHSRCLGCRPCPRRHRRSSHRLHARAPRPRRPPLQKTSAEG